MSSIGQSLTERNVSCFKGDELPRNKQQFTNYLLHNGKRSFSEDAESVSMVMGIMTTIIGDQK